LKPSIYYWVKFLSERQRFWRLLAQSSFSI